MYNVRSVVTSPQEEPVPLPPPPGPWWRGEGEEDEELSDLEPDEIEEYIASEGEVYVATRVF